MASLLHRYFSYSLEGLENIPAVGGAILVSPHGLLPIDGLLLRQCVLEQCQRLVHGMSHVYWHRVPLVSSYLQRRGFHVGGQGVARGLLEDGHLLHTMPGGVPEAFRPSSQAYNLSWGRRRGYIRLALRCEVPIIPVVTAGIDDLYEVSESAWALTDRLFPQLKGKIPRARGLGPLPWPLAIPLRRPLRSVIGQPLDVSTWFESHHEKERLEAIHRRCTDEIQTLWRSAQGLAFER